MSSSSRYVEWCLLIICCGGEGFEIPDVHLFRGEGKAIDYVGDVSAASELKLKKIRDTQIGDYLKENFGR